MLDKIGAFLDELNGSTLWAYLKSVIAKIAELLDFYGEDEAKTIINIIPKD